MLKKCNLKLSLLVALLIGCLSMQSQAMHIENTSSKIASCKKSIKICKPKGPNIKPSDDTMRVFYNIFDELNIYRDSSHRYKSATCYIGHLSYNIKLNKCPIRYFESLNLISNPPSASETDEWSCPYCGHKMTWTKNCTCPNTGCLSNWAKLVCRFKVPITKIRNTNGYRERLCLLPAFILLICEDYGTELGFVPVAKEWAIQVLVAGHNQNWEYVDKLFKKSVTTRDIKDWLELAYQAYAKN